MELRYVVDFYLEGILIAARSEFAGQPCKFNAKTMINGKKCGGIRENSSTSNG
jgi:hypothetical protein